MKITDKDQDLKYTFSQMENLKRSLIIRAKNFLNSHPEFNDFKRFTVIKIPSGQQFGLAANPETDEIIWVGQGKGVLVYEKVRIEIKQGDSIFIKAGKQHNFINSGWGDLLLVKSSNA